MKKTVSTIQRVLNVWAIILIIWSIYRTKFRLPEWFDEFIAKPIVFILPVFWYIKKYENKNFFDAIWFDFKKIFADLYLGISIGLIFAISAFLSNLIRSDGISLGNPIFSIGISKLSLFFITALATGISEEILSRGFILKRLYEDSQNVFVASFNASILFFILHIPILFTNAKLSGSLLMIFMVTDLILSLANSFIFLQRKSLFLPILIHAFYNLAIILYI
ncbi:hypothetical protein A3C23_05155 [Candidatus Roizmanbacteria bacterium RIFCSPHIGHO2_02_FULL_37_13b]|uniref:CAAX prenyl protease 2/Lysostaphin resistance protein A-like domain-containing protein n=1 Tax=Candidatus Roizmanbacteria bacterium RIFCSPLOWO2_02_FULL_36_11 TaxID=1802071 RepID=A0A1F7JFM7_9BACT|nr:MAG: hypothetical protein A3C23_05155 [Candidatus Roizmanbacteria bacterium RIFCSPHIGHO2_02_FULL_37_13b]OGK54409.1 MAG: hypothetical protein A3H78_03765 [Candidatus Roizmanbacteria bacterium RIFCSPLOWO2_02_FULL_36_11]